MPLCALNTVIVERILPPLLLDDEVEKRVDVLFDRHPELAKL